MNQKIKCLNGFQLKVLAMVCMVCSHMSSTILWGMYWLDSIGRLAFPIFAFLLAEGFRHTSNVKKYLLRLFLFALVTELPFNLMSEGGLLYPFHPNVLFTFCIALLMMAWIERAKGTSSPRFILRVVLAIIVGYLLGFITFVDSFGYGVLMALTFYLFHEYKYGWAAELAIMVHANDFHAETSDQDIPAFWDEYYVNEEYRKIPGHLGVCAQKRTEGDVLRIYKEWLPVAE